MDVPGTLADPDRHRPPRRLRSICRCSTRATRCWRGCAARTHSTTTAASWTHCAIDCRTPRSARTSSSAFPAKPMTDFDRLCRYLESSPLTSLHVFPYPIVLAPRRRRSSERCPVRWSRSAGEWCATSATGLAARFRAEQAGTSRPALTIEGRIGRHHRQRAPRPNRAGPPAERANPVAVALLTPPGRCTLLHVNSHGSPETPPARPRVCATAMQARLPDPILTVDRRAAHGARRIRCHGRDHDRLATSCSRSASTPIPETIHRVCMDSGAAVPSRQPGNRRREEVPRDRRRIRRAQRPREAGAVRRLPSTAAAGPLEAR